MTIDPADRDNNLIATGVVLASLRNRGAPLNTVEVVADSEGNATNQIDITLSFMNSPYRITVERVDKDHPSA